MIAGLFAAIRKTRRRLCLQVCTKIGKLLVIYWKRIEEIVFPDRWSEACLSRP
jgi:hypothetical protein